MMKNLFCQVSIACLLLGTSCSNPAHDDFLSKDAVNDAIDTTAISPQLTVTIRNAFDRYQSSSVSSYLPLIPIGVGSGQGSDGKPETGPSINYFPTYGGYTYHAQSWARVTSSHPSAPRVDTIRFTLCNVYFVDGGSGLATLGECRMEIGGHVEHGEYSEVLPLLRAQDTYIDVNSFEMVPGDLSQQYMISWNPESLPALVRTSYPSYPPTVVIEEPPFDSINIYSISPTKIKPLYHCKFTPY